MKVENKTEKKRLIRHILCKVESSQDAINSEDIAKSVDVLYAIRFLNGAIKDIKKDTVLRCFLKAGFRFNGTCDDESDDCFEDDDIPILELVKAMKQRNIIAGSTDVNEYSCLDDDIQVHEELSSDWESQLVKKLRKE
ncbi:hypothetical protein ACF0H5_010458 [Mactra antiquata]